MHIAVRAPRNLLLVVSALVLAACTTTVPADHTTPTTPSESTVRPTNSTGRPTEAGLSWHTCRGSYQCATLSVPLDWFHKTGDTIDLALVRKPATDPHPVGSLLLNPGGPGEPGTDFLDQLLSSGTFPASLRKRFDLVSWDPRGTGASAGVACLTTAELTEPDPLPYPPTAAARSKVAAKDRAQQDRCLSEDGKVIPYVSTKETVHDLDAIRAALGDAKLTYVGFSYGTAIGLEYLTTFPTHVRAMALDGIDLPGSDPIASAKAQIASFESNLDAFLAACKADSSCPFGGGQPAKALDAFLARLQSGVRIPAAYVLPDDNGHRHERNGTVGYAEALEGMIAALYNRDSWSVLEQGLADASRSRDPDGHVLLALRDLLAGRDSDGTWSHITEANTAISCADQTQRATSDFGDPARIVAWSKEIPVFGEVGAVGLPGCYQWPEAKYPLHALTKSEFAKAPPVVLVNSLHDPATPFADAVRAKALLPTARLVTWGGDDHTSFGQGHACIDDAVTPYLIAGTLPADGISCPAPKG